MGSSLSHTTYSEPTFPSSPSSLSPLSSSFTSRSSACIAHLPLWCVFVWFLYVQKCVFLCLYDFLLLLLWLFFLRLFFRSPICLFLFHFLLFYLLQVCSLSKQIEMLWNKMERTHVKTGKSRGRRNCNIIWNKPIFNKKWIMYKDIVYHIFNIFMFDL